MRVWLAAVYLALVLGACSSSRSSSSGGPECQIGTERCSCTQGGACDPGLVCLSSVCVHQSGVGGTAGGTSNVGGSSTAGGASGGSGADSGPPPPPTCSKTSDCANGEVCALTVQGSGVCLQGSGKSCEAGDVCVDGIGFTPGEGSVEGPICFQAGDCRQAVKGHLNHVCLMDDAGAGTCAVLCQYSDDPARLKCATHPQLGIWSACNRTQIRSAVSNAFFAPCVDLKVVAWACLSNPPAATADEETTLACTEQVIEQGGSCVSHANCFRELQSTAPLGVSQFYTFLKTQITWQTEASPSSSSGGSKCGTDCDCGRCSYCESGTCRYGGEGPYGCYRGCN
jgi:hypothetical protein